MPTARPSLPLPTLVLVTDRSRLRGRSLADAVHEAVSGGVNIVQLREKDLASDELVALGQRVRDAITGRALLFVNGDVAAAMALDADGVHIPEGGPNTDAIRAKVGERMLVSRAVHGREAAIQAQRDGADLIQLGTVFETTSKPDGRTLGLAALQECCAAVTTPIIAIGGITASNAAGAIHAGAAGVAVIGAILDATDPRDAATALRQTIEAAAGDRPARASMLDRG